MSQVNKRSDTSAPPADAGAPKVRWDDSKMKTSYANVVNAASTREEFMLFFGTNQTWNLSSGQEVTVDLTDRVILNPLAAKRLMVLLGNVLQQYETRYGPLDIGVSEPPATS